MEILKEFEKYLEENYNSSKKMKRIIRYRHICQI